MEGGWFVGLHEPIGKIHPELERVDADLGRDAAYEARHQLKHRDQDRVLVQPGTVHLSTEQLERRL